MNSKNSKKVFKIPDRLQLKTYSHLAEQKRIPNEYELVTSKMLYYFEKGGFEVNTPISAWYEQYQKNSLISASTLDQFVDPRQTTYFAYIQRQKDQEIVLDANFKHIDETHYDAQLDEQWLECLSQVIAPLRYPWHGLQMIASYLGSMAPEGKVVIVFAFQTMDEMRRIQRIAYRMRQLQLTYPSFGVNSLEQWQNAPLWQPLRRAIERLLVTYDWLESVVALNLCFKPILDQLFLIHFASTAKKQGDSQLDMIFHSFWEDACWQQQWSVHLVELILKENKQNKSIVKSWLTSWIKELMPAVEALKPIFLGDFDLVCENTLTTYAQMLAKLDLQIKVSL